MWRLRQGHQFGGRRRMRGLQRSASPPRLLVRGLLANLRVQRPNVRRGCLAETEHLAMRDGYGEPPPPPRLHR